MEDLIITYVVSVISTFVIRVKIHVNNEDLSILDLMQYSIMAVLPAFNLIFTAAAVYDEYSGSLRDMVVIKARIGSNPAFNFLKVFDKNTIEIVTMSNMLYAVRKTRARFKYFKKVTYLNLQYREQIWLDRTHDNFKECLTDDLGHATLKFERLTIVDNGTPLGNKCAMSINDVIPMLKMSESDPGLNDLLTAAKEWYVLKTNH